MRTRTQKLWIPIALIASIMITPTFVSAQCDEAEHSTNWEDAWLSCDLAESPNAERADGHWIMYDLGDVYQLYTSKIWNFNVSGETGKGVRNCFFDVSLDGENWDNWGSFEVPEAPGSDDYIGTVGPDFEGIAARYLLISVDTNWDGDPCSGFAEIRVEREYLGVGIEENKDQLHVEVYPNPTADFINVNHYKPGDFQLRILNANGQVVYDHLLNSTSMRIDVSQFPSGAYLLFLSDDNGNKGTQRFVVSP